MKFQINLEFLIFFSIALHLPSHAEPLRILSYSSFIGKGSLGEFLQKEFPNYCSGCAVTFKSTDEISGLIGKLRSEKSKKTSRSFDAVIGLDSHFFSMALTEGLIKNGKAFDQSSFAFIVDTERLAEKDWPSSWKQLNSKFKNSILISDPRLSSTGFGWLLSIFHYKHQSLESAKSLTLRIFPSWSSAYSSFLKGEGTAVWSYQSSEAYHFCNEKLDKEKRRYRALPLKEGYPTQVEYFAETSFSKHPLAIKFSEFLLSAKVQAAIPLTNWMFPINAATPLPECFKKLRNFSVNPDVAQFTKVEIQSWMDQWAL